MFALAERASQSACALPATGRAGQADHAALAAENERLTAELYALRAENASLATYRTKYAQLKNKIARVLESRADGGVAKRARLFVYDDEAIDDDPFAFPEQPRCPSAPSHAQPALPARQRGFATGAATPRPAAAALPARQRDFAAAAAPRPAAGSSALAKPPAAQPAAPRPHAPTVFPHVQVVRKKAERERLPAYVCNSCEEFYRVTGLASGNACRDCSRHRSAFAFHETPPGFWNPGFDETVTQPPDSLALAS